MGHVLVNTEGAQHVAGFQTGTGASTATAHCNVLQADFFFLLLSFFSLETSFSVCYITNCKVARLPEG
jgi:hypothetical protein